MEKILLQLNSIIKDVGNMRDRGGCERNEARGTVLVCFSVSFAPPPAGVCALKAKALSK
jgi:hypothetical protein